MYTLCMVVVSERDAHFGHWANANALCVQREKGKTREYRARSQKTRK